MKNLFPTPLMNLSRVQEFATQADQLRELMQSFERSLVQEMAQLKTAFDQNDQEQVSLSLHVLKGFMPMFSVPEFAQATADLYQQSRREALSVTRTSYADLLPSLDSLLSEVRAWLGPL